jgi:hypothetical protein
MSFFFKMSATYTEAFGRMGCGFKLISQPGERAMVDANQGIVDGEAGRISNIDRKKYANLIMVPYPIVTMEDGAYATDHSIKINGWESLAGKPYKVGLLKGIKSVEQKLPLYVDKKNIVTLSDVEQGIKMLQAKRIDLFIVGTQVEDSAYMQSGAYKEVKRVGILETKVLYPWLHKRHRAFETPAQCSPEFDRHRSSGGNGTKRRPHHRDLRGKPNSRKAHSPRFCIILFRCVRSYGKYRKPDGNGEFGRCLPAPLVKSVHRAGYQRS